MTGTDTELGGNHQEFPRTEWALVEGLRQGDKRAQAVFWELYWKPSYVFFRVLGRSNEDAKDLTQSFLAEELETSSLHRALEGKHEATSFRRYMKGALRNFDRNSRRAEGAQKRGGGLAFAPLPDDQLVGANTRLATGSLLTPEEAFEEQYERDRLQLCLGELKGECEATGQSLPFRVFADWYKTAASPAELASNYGAPERDVTNWLRKLLDRLKRLIESKG